MLKASCLGEISFAWVSNKVISPPRYQYSLKIKLWIGLLSLRSLTTSLPIIQKVCNWFAMHINWLVSIWRETLVVNELKLMIHDINNDISSHFSITQYKNKYWEKINTDKINYKKYWEKINIDIINWEKLFW